jgi:hypothetical protein
MHPKAGHRDCRWCRLQLMSSVPPPPDRESRDAAVLRQHGFEVDPVIEAYKKDVDRTLLRQNLQRTPDERWRNFLNAMRLADEVRQSGAKARGR